MILESDFGLDSSFWYNTYCRRERREEGKRVVDHVKICSPQTLDIHNEWVNTQRNALSGKVEVVFGKENRKIFEKKYILEALQLWTEPPVTVYLEFTTQDKDYISRVLFFIPHPERFFKNIARDAAVLQDKALEIAAVMAGLPVREEKQAKLFENRSVVYDWKQSQKKAGLNSAQNGKQGANRAFVEVEKAPKKPRATITLEYRISKPDETVDVVCVGCGTDFTDWKPDFWSKDERKIML